MKHLIFMFVALSSYALCAQSTSLWTSTSNLDTSPLTKHQQSLPRHQLYKLDFEALKLLLKNAPLRGTQNAKNSNVIITLPNSKGNIERFRIIEAPVMHPKLSATYPNIKSYAGQGIDTPSYRVRFSISPKGIESTQFSGTHETSYITALNNNIYTVYTQDDISKSPNSKNFECHTEAQLKQLITDTVDTSKNANDGLLHTFRLAVSTDGEYTQYHGSPAGALAAINATMTRVNGIFETDFGITMQLIPNNMDIIYADSDTDPYNFNLNNELQQTLTQEIGAANYDIGHLFSQNGFSDAGDAGCIGCACINNEKGSGWSSSVNPTGEQFDLLVAHEMGHQFGANHTFTIRNENTDAHFEPGSGSTIMGYAGITGFFDVQNETDPYFHAHSIWQVTEYINTTNCQTQNATGNGIPIVDAGPNYIIPASTPFMLEGTANDPDPNDVLTYCWEQMDENDAETLLPNTNNITGVTFRSYPPTSNPVRYFPRLETVKTGVTNWLWEAIPTVSRDLNFRLTVRDNQLGGGANDSDDITLTVNAAAGPFLLTYPNENGIEWISNTTQTVTWDVAGTTEHGINANTVDIYLSDDGGNTYPMTLASNIPNTGSHDITVPNISGDHYRIMIKGHNHIFFDISNADFKIQDVCTLVSMPYQEGFENGFGNWRQYENDDKDWAIHTTIGGNTIDVIEGTHFAFGDTQDNTPGYRTAILNSPCFDFTNKTAATISFSYYMHGFDYHTLGSGAIGALDLEISADGGVTWTSIWSQSGFTGTIGQFWQTVEVNVSDFLDHIVEFRFVRYGGPGITANILIDDIRVEEREVTQELCIGGITSYPYVESFDNASKSWTQSSEDDIDWTFHFGTTPSSNTGPSTANHGDRYAYVEASYTNHPQKQAILESPCFDLSTLSEPMLSFNYHMYGSNDMGTFTLEVSTDAGTSWNSIWNQSGNQGNTWHHVDLDLSAYRNIGTQFRFNRTTGHTWKADIAIDHIIVQDASDLCLTPIASFPYSENFEGTLGGWTQSVNDDLNWLLNTGATFTNNGPSEAAEGTHYLFVNTVHPSTSQKQATLNSPCFDFSTMTAATVNFKYYMFGNNDIGTLSLDISTDEGITWTTIWETSTSSNSPSWQTANVNISSHTGGTAILRFNRLVGQNYWRDVGIDAINILEEAETTCFETILSYPYHQGFENGFDNWAQSSNDDHDWAVHSGNTNSNGTGPSAAIEGSNYAFVNAEGLHIGYPQKEAFLYSPCFDLNSMTEATFSFKYHMYGNWMDQMMGSLALEVSNDFGATWTNIWDVEGDQGDSWRSVILDISDYTGTNALFRFKRITGNSWQGDVAIDDINLNEGLDTFNGCSSGINIFPYHESFENTYGDWIHGNSNDHDWYLRTGETPSGGTGPSGAIDGNYYIYAEASGNHHPNKTMIIQSPCFDLTNINQATFNFKYHMLGSNNMGTFDLEISEDDGVSWTSIWDKSSNQGNTWHLVNVNLSSYSGKNILLRFKRITGGSWKADIAIDDISLEEGVSTNCTSDINSFPYQESFENTLGEWIQSNEDDIDWIIDTNGTPSNNTGPSNAYEGNYYIYVEASTPNFPHKQAVLTSPCFDLNDQSDALFGFKYHMYGSNNMGTLKVEVSDDNGNQWNTVWSRSSNKGNNWFYALIDLSNYTGSAIQIRFNRITGTNWKADIAIDDIELKTTPIVKSTLELNTLKSAPEITDPYLSIYPNPVNNNYLYVKTELEHPSYIIFNNLGQVIYSGQLNDDKIDVGNLNKGLFFIEFSSNSKTFRKRFIKN